MRTWTLYVCHECGNGTTEEAEDLCCLWCGAVRSEIEAVKVVEVEDE